MWLKRSGQVSYVRKERTPLSRSLICRAGPGAGPAGQDACPPPPEGGRDPPTPAAVWAQCVLWC